MLHLLRLSIAISLLLSVNLFLVSWAVAQNADANLHLDRSDVWSQRSFWISQNGKEPGDHWEFLDGEVRLLKPASGEGNLLSPPMPETFDFSFEWKMESKTNSGIKYRVRRFDHRWLGIEYQILDEPQAPKVPSKGATASIYDLFPPDIDRELHPPGVWNASRIVARKNQIEHYLNGKKVARAETHGVAWERAIALSKFYGLPEFGQPMPGDRIMLTDHGGKIAFRNFRLIPVTQEESEANRRDSRPAPQLANAFRNGWGDQTSIVLWSRTTAFSEMKRDGDPFLELSSKQVQELSQSNDEKLLVSSQLPPNRALTEMEGAVPGAPGELQLTYFPQAKKNRSKTIPWKQSNPEMDYTLQWRLTDLEPGTDYAAIVEARPIGRDQVSAVVRGSFRTAPRSKDSADVQFCVTTCHDYVRRDDHEFGHKIYRPMSMIHPDFVVHAGDIEYYDHKSPWGWTKELMRFKWGRLFALPKNREFYANTTSYFLKDDHDTLKDDCYAGQRYGAVTFEEGVKIFNEEQFPSHFPRYQTISWGKDLQLWLLEGRDFRSPNKMPDGPTKTILGDKQKEWLYKTLEDSNATFKLVFSPTPIVGPDRTNKHDNHANVDFEFEGNQLRNRLAKISGLILFCGDRHWQYASVDRETGLWEFGCGPGSEVHQLGWKKGDVRPEHQFLRVEGGFLSGKVQVQGQKSPTLTLSHHGVTGEKVSEFTFPTK